MYIETRVQWTINFGSSHMRVHACDTEACDMCYVFNVTLTDSFDNRRSMPFDRMIVLPTQTLIPRISN